jgi:hypothetical protein
MRAWSSFRFSGLNFFYGINKSLRNVLAPKIRANSDWYAIIKAAENTRPDQGCDRRFRPEGQIGALTRRGGRSGHPDFYPPARYGTHRSVFNK